MKKELYNLLYITFAFLILLLSMFNLQNLRQKETQVLGVSTDNKYFEELVTKYPTYIDGWVELGRMDKDTKLILIFCHKAQELFFRLFFWSFTFTCCRSCTFSYSFTFNCNWSFYNLFFGWSFHFNYYGF